MDEFEKFLNKAKDIAMVAVSKTEEAIDKGKAKLDVKKAEYDIKKLYEKIGKTVYEEAEAGENFSDAVSLILAEIDELKEKIADIENETL